jgi:hypothetical protein
MEPLEYMRRAVGADATLRGLTGAPQLNGARCVVVPSPPAVRARGRVAVRLRGGEEVAVRPENVALDRDAPAPPPASAPYDDRDEDDALTALVRADVRRGQVPLRLSLQSLRGSGLADPLIRCASCGFTAAQAADAGGDDAYFVALECTAPLRATPLPRSALQLSCIACLARDAHSCGVPARADAVGAFVDARCMGACQACSQLMQFVQLSWEGEGIRPGKRY